MTKNIIDKKIDVWTDEEVLTEFMKFLPRIQFDTDFIQEDADEEIAEGVSLITHQVLTISCGEKLIVSDPMPLVWPMQPLPMPESLKGVLN